MAFLLGGSKPKTNSVKPDYTGLQIQTAVNTLPIPILFGRTKLAPNLIWSDDFKAIAHTQKQKGGKGGGGGSSTSTTYTYSTSVVMGLCEGPIAQVTTVWAGQTVSTLSGLGFILYNGSGTQAPWGYLTSAHSDKALAYPWTATIAQANYDMGSSNSLPNHNLEVWGLLAGTGVNGRSDADPVLCAQSFLTDPGYGVLFPAASIDGVSWFSGALAQSSGDSAWQTWCRAMGIDFSPCLNSQESAATILERWFQLTNTAPVWSAGLLKAIPFATTPVSGHGFVFTPNVTPVYDLSDRDFVRDQGQDPVRIARVDPADQFNCYRMEFTDSANSYNVSTVESKDQSFIEDYGLRVASTITAHEITTSAVASLVVELIKQRSLTTPLTFTFKLSWEFCLLEPMDLVTLTDPGLGLDHSPVRITAIEEDDQGILTITAENFPAGVATATAYPRQASQNNALNTGVVPASVNPPVIFEPSPLLTNGAAQVWIAVSGGSNGAVDPNWGGCDVYLSVDGTTYQMIGQITAPARMGVLTSALPGFGGANPDAINTLAVSLAMSGGQLVSGASSDAAAGRTLCYCDGELLSYTTATLTGAQAYGLTGLYRGQYGASPAAHASGAPFARLDAAVFHYDLPAAMVGQPLFLKLPSINVFGAATQSLANCVAYSYTPSGVGFQIAAPSSVTITPAARTQADGTSLISLTISWTASAGPLVGGYDIQWQVSGAAGWQDLTAGASSTSVVIQPVAASTLYAVRVRTVSQNGQAVSAWTNATPVNSGGLVSASPPVPTGLTGVAAPQANQLLWTAPAPSITTGVYAYHGSGGSFAQASKIATVSGSSTLHVGLGVADSWSYWITAINAAGESAPAGPLALTTQSAAAAPYDIAGSLAGAPTAGQVLFRLEMVRSVVFPANLTGSLATCQIAPTGSVTLPIKKNGGAVGSIAFAAGSTSGSFTLASGLSVAAGDVLELDAPTPADASLAGLSYTLTGTR